MAYWLDRTILRTQVWHLRFATLTGSLYRTASRLLLDCTQE